MRRQWLGIWAAVFLGIIFVVAGTGKIFAQSGNLDPLRLPEYLFPPLAQAISSTLPWVEIMVGCMLILGIAIKLTTGFSALMIGGFIANNIALITLGLANEPCGCFGGAIGGGLSISTALMLDGVMVVMALLIFVFHPSSFTSIRPWCLTTEQKADGGLVALEKRRVA